MPPSKEQNIEKWEQLWADFTNGYRTNEEVREFFRQTLREQLTEILAEMPTGDENPFKHDYTKGWNDCIGEARKPLTTRLSSLDSKV